MYIAKEDGTSEPFKPEKLVASLMRAGAKPDIAQDIARTIEQGLEEGMSTHEIYSRAFAELREHKHVAAARYSLKRAILDFGPSGFPFEAYIAELFRVDGYTALVDQIIQGKCVDHEVDVVLTKGGEKIFVEAKFHNTPGFKTDLKTVLYVQARIDDIGHKGLVVTNTKFTSKALQYAECRGLPLLGWDYPQGNNLHDRIDAAGLYPVTALTTLSHREKTALLSERVVLCKSLPEKAHVLTSVGLSGKKIDAVLEEVGALCVPGSDI